jgi:hypothetical protein
MLSIYTKLTLGHVNNSHQTCDFVLPEGEVTNGVHRGKGQDQDLKNGRKTFLKVCLKTKTKTKTKKNQKLIIYQLQLSLIANYITFLRKVSAICNNYKQTSNNKVTNSRENQ